MTPNETSQTDGSRAVSDPKTKAERLEAAQRRRERAQIAIEEARIAMRKAVIEWDEADCEVFRVGVEP